MQRLMEQAAKSTYQRKGSGLPRLGKAARPAANATPQPVQGTAGTPVIGNIFVGRRRELALLRAALDDACAGSGGRLALLTGEPGIGKTRLAEYVAGQAQRNGAVVLRGRCWEGGGAPPFWPWAQAIRSYIMGRDSSLLQQELGTCAPYVARVVSEVRDCLPDIPQPPSLEPERTQFHSFDSIARLLANASRRQPIVLVLDDLQWADTDSLLLLRFIAHEIGDTRLLLLVTCRDTDIARAGLWQRTLAEVARAPRSVCIGLNGLRPAAVAAYMESATGKAPGRELVAAVMARTEGQPFFVREVVRLLQLEGYLESPLDGGRGAAAGNLARIGVPDAVRECITRRLARLSPHTNRLLRIAAVAGDGFSAASLAAASAVTHAGRRSRYSSAGGKTAGGDVLAQVHHSLAEAVGARILAAVPEAPGHYSFTHVLMREQICGALSPGNAGLTKNARQANPVQLAARSAAQVEAENLLRCDGDYWTIRFAGQECRLRNTRPLHYLAHLLRHPGHEFHAIDVVASARPASSRSATSATSALADGLVIRATLGDAGPVLDARATAAYKRRLAELRAELREAESQSDLGRAGRVRGEIEFIAAQLAAAMHRRKVSSHAERARQAVTKGLKNVLAKVRTHHPVLASHLSATIKRGYFCSYTPDPRHSTIWKCTLLLLLRQTIEAAGLLSVLTAG
jgi:hypothetical protein